MFRRLYHRILAPKLHLCRIYYIHWGLLPGYLLLQVVRLIWCSVQSVYWELNGIGKHIRAIKRGELYEQSAHALDVLFYVRAVPTDKVRNSQFLTVHSEFLHPEIVLQDNVIIADIDNKGALFLELKRSIEHYTPSELLFLWMGVGYHTRRLIWLPLDSCFRLADQIGDPASRNQRVTFLFNSGRCGSTLMVKIVHHADPKTMVLSEPPVLMSLYCLKLHTTTDRFRRITRAALFLLLKPTSNEKICRYVVKPIFFILNLAEDIHGALRSAHCYFIYRQPLKMVLAHDRAFAPTIFFKLVQLSFYLKRWDEGQQYVGFHRDSHVAHCANTYLKPTMFETCVVIWADNLINYLRQANEFYFPAYLYDKVFDGREQFCTDVLDMCGVPRSCLGAAMSCMDQDAQDGCMFSQSMLKPCPFTKISTEQKLRINRFCDALHLPRLVPESRERVTVLKKSLKSPIDLLLQAPNNYRIGDFGTSSKTLIKPFPVQCMITSDR
ncbi:hypothetical protein TTRE_0000231401 [Trichuris trichiura]|uniref:Uncharacterized protein n=1 Tax=Trichuris trichiura TaxID=36087 RepID=A0A077Z5T1_TRITR|nr:hypothetical protein TTRE_0000231401 [Trichuris trichiura]